MSWTDDRVADLKRMWADGLSASQIAARLGGVTRNAVLSKVHRLGIAARPDGGPEGRARRARLQCRSRKKAGLPPGGWTPMRLAPPQPGSQPSQPSAIPHLAAEPFEEMPEDVIVPVGERRGVADLEPHHCRWPIGDPRHADFHFCNRNRIAGLSYCADHARRAYPDIQIGRAETVATPEPVARAPELVDA